MWRYYIGLDLASKEKNPTGIFIGDVNIVQTVYKNIEILNLIRKFSPAIISIDAPLSYKKPYRDGELELLKLGFRPLPLSIKTMEELYKRAKRLKDEVTKINKQNIVIETFPRAVEKIFSFTYKKFSKYFKNKHEYDAWLCYITAKSYALGKYLELPDKIILPKI